MTPDLTTTDLWPALPLEEWRDTYATLHMWTQMVGKTFLALAPRQNHWWQVALRVTARGLATGPMPYGSRTLDAEFDFVNRHWRILVQIDDVFKRFRAPFLGKCSPVHFFWGSFDLAVTRFSGRRAPERPGADRVTQEGYSHEVISAGFWPGSGAVQEAAFYAYAAPEPAGLRDAGIRPSAAYFQPQMSVFILPYAAVRTASSPEDALLAFLQSTYDAAADLARWDREALERRP